VRGKALRRGALPGPVHGNGYQATPWSTLAYAFEAVTQLGMIVDPKPRQDLPHRPAVPSGPQLRAVG
jgi:hypothetical protein